MDSESKEPVQVDPSFFNKLIGLLQRLLNDIWTSPINLVLTILIVCLLVKLLLVKRKPSSNSSQKRVSAQLPKMPKIDLTVQQLRGYNGIESNGRILTAIYGDIFDVSKRSDLYGLGKFTYCSLFQRLFGLRGGETLMSRIEKVTCDR